MCERAICASFVDVFGQIDEIVFASFRWIISIVFRIVSLDSKRVIAREARFYWPAIDACALSFVFFFLCCA